MSSVYISRDRLTNIVDFMIKKAKKSKNKVSVECLLPANDWIENKYWSNYIEKVVRSINHYCEVSGVTIDVDWWSSGSCWGKYTIKQLEIIKYILSLRRNNVRKGV